MFLVIRNKGPLATGLMDEGFLQGGDWSPKNFRANAWGKGLAVAFSHWESYCVNHVSPVISE